MSPDKNTARATRKWPKALPTDLVLARKNETAITSGEALAALFFQWSEAHMANTAERLTVAEPTEMANGDLRRCLTDLANKDDFRLEMALYQAAKTGPGETLVLDNDAMAKLRKCFQSWSKVEGSDIMRVFLPQHGPTNGAAHEFMDGLKLCPNRAFTWRLIHPSIHSWPIQMQSFRQMLWVQRVEFIHDSVHDFGRPLPIMELGEIWHHMPDHDMMEATIHQVLSPPELAYCLAHGVFQLEVKGNITWPPAPSDRPRLKLNPLFIRSR